MLNETILKSTQKFKFAAMKLATKFELLVMQCTNLDKGDRVECRATWTKLQCAFKLTPLKKTSPRPIGRWRSIARYCGESR